MQLLLGFKGLMYKLNHYFHQFRELDVDGE
jgi:hypothetical protein